ncbi:Lipoyltransferase 1 mitochondrial [Echinococcus multilocularis]|uniref:Lipoyltransferase 1 mitochondrial n=1 Tax=Echinococcus multilocularis TaxID=6211 RepID=A0A068YBT5_ECHMU|nr:Lipoyltransferase 1 mitochondrial [Echinococcus multilocularis]
MFSVSRLCRISRLFEARIFRNFASQPTPNRVYWLSSGNIYRNLAFETALFNNNTRYAMKPSSQIRPADVVIWRSDPCVVIGRNQIAWLEASPREVEGRGWLLARRMSGGGAVFHDHGNLNISFLESRKNFDRRKCMEFLQQTLMSRWTKLNVFVGPRHDLWLLPPGLSVDANTKTVPDGAFKFSGSASRYSSTAGLHHCTLMFDTDVSAMSAVLEPAVPEIETRASRSICSPVKNLGVTETELKSTLFGACAEWLTTDTVDEKAELITVNAGEECEWVNAKDFEANLTTFQSWDWIYGSSPKFSIPMETDSGTLLCLDCEKGRIKRLKQVKILVASTLLQRISSAIIGQSAVNHWLDKLNEALVGKRLSFEAIHNTLLEFEMSNSTSSEANGSADPFNNFSQIIDRLRAMATCF